MKNALIILSVILVSLLVVNTDLYAQCAMCKATLESNAKSGNPTGSGLNSGILYLMSIPYILFAIIAFMWYKNSKKNKEKQSSIVNILKGKLA